MTFPRSRINKRLVLCGVLALALCGVATGRRFLVQDVREHIDAQNDPSYDSRTTPVKHLAQLIQTYPNAKHYWVQWVWNRPFFQSHSYYSITYDSSQDAIVERYVGEPSPPYNPTYADVTKSDIMQGAEQDKRVSDLGRSVPCDSAEYKRYGGD